MIDKPELKPCPFCGGEVEMLTWGGEKARLITCDDCHFSSRLFRFEHFKENMESEAIKWWNTRADLAKPSEELENDKARLDWLQDQKTLCYFDDEDGMWATGNGLMGVGQTIREAIDSAIRIDNAELRQPPPEAPNET